MASLNKKKTNNGALSSRGADNDSAFLNQNSSTDDVMNTLSEDTFLGHKCEAVRSLLSMLHTDDDLSASEKFMQMTQHREANELLRKNGCLKSIVQLIHKQMDVTCCKPTHEDMQIVTNASTALRQAVLKHNDEESKNKEMHILSQLELLRVNVLNLRSNLGDASFAKNQSSKMGKIFSAMDTLQKLSFEQQYRIITLELGGLQAIAETLIIDHFVFGLSNNLVVSAHTEFRYNIGVALTNLTFKSVDSKSLLCNYPKFLDVLNQYVDCDVDNLKSISAGVLRNICFKADATCRLALRNSGAAGSLIRSAMRSESNLSAVRSSLAALWNLSDFGFETDKKDICSTPGALEFLLSILRCDGNVMSTDPKIYILENASGVLRNISQYVASITEYRSIVRRNQGYEILLDHLKSSSLTVVANVCFCLWNFSAGDPKDGLYLIELGAQEALKGLLFSKHKLISLGSEETLKNLASLKSSTKSRTESISNSTCCSNNKNLKCKNENLQSSKTYTLTVQQKDVKISNFDQEQDDFSNDQESMKIYVVEGNCKQNNAENGRINTQFSTDSARIVNEDTIMPLMPRSEPGSKQATTGLPTPMMYSRHSSMQSLDSCDHYSINSNVPSEYSQLPTGQQSPSDVPDSPTQQMPPAAATFAVRPPDVAVGGVAPPAVFNRILMVDDSYNFARLNNYRRDVTQNVGDVGVAAGGGQFYDMESLRAYKQEDGGDGGSVITEFSGLTTESEKIKPLGRKLPPATNIVGGNFAASGILPQRPAAAFGWNTPSIRTPASSSQFFMFRPRTANVSVVNYPPNIRPLMNQNTNNNCSIAPPSSAIQNLIRLGLPKQNVHIRSYNNPALPTATDDEEKLKIYLQEGPPPSAQNVSQNAGRAAGDPSPPDDPYFAVGGDSFCDKNAVATLPSSSSLKNERPSAATPTAAIRRNFFADGSLPAKSAKKFFLSNNSTNQSYLNGRNSTNQIQTNSTVTPSLPIQKLIQLGLPKSLSSRHHVEYQNEIIRAENSANDDGDGDDDGGEKLRSYGEDKSLFVLDFNNDENSPSTPTISKKTPTPNVLPLTAPSPRRREKIEPPQPQLMASPLMQYCINLALPKAKKTDDKKSSHNHHHHHTLPNKTSNQISSPSPNLNIERRRDQNLNLIRVDRSSSENLRNFDNKGYCNNDNTCASETPSDFETSFGRHNSNFGQKPNFKDSLMQISTSSNLIKTHSTSENIKDAAILTPAADDSPTSPSKIEWRKKSPQAVMYNSGSFSEDNYSRKSEEEEEFLVDGGESSKEIFDFTIISDENAEDETLTSELITITNLQIDKNNDQENLQTFVDDCKSSCKQAATNFKPNQSSSDVPASPSCLHAPKLVVRSTKTVDLRLQAQASSGCVSSNNSRSGSPHGVGDQSSVKFSRNAVERSSSTSNAAAVAASKMCRAANGSPRGGVAATKNSPPRKTPAVAAATKPALPPKPQKRGGDGATPPPPILHPKPPKNSSATSSSSREKTPASPSTKKTPASPSSSKSGGQITTV